MCPRKCIDVEKIPSHSAAPRGATGAGKSHYIASLPLAHQPGWFGFEQRSLDWIGGTEFSEDRVVIDPTQAIGKYFQPRVVTGEPAREGTQRHYGLYVGTLAIGDDPRDWQSAWLIDMPGEMFRPEAAALLNNAFSVDVADLIIVCVDLSVPRRAILTTSRHCSESVRYTEVIAIWLSWAQRPTNSGILPDSPRNSRRYRPTLSRRQILQIDRATNPPWPPNGCRGSPGSRTFRKWLSRSVAPASILCPRRHVHRSIMCFLLSNRFGYLSLLCMSTC